MRCFWDDANGVPFNVSHYTVKVGKYHREYDYIKEPEDVQSISIKNVTKSPAWEGSNNGFLDDIAILLLDDYIVFKAHIGPLCIDSDLKYNNDNEGLRFSYVPTVDGLNQSSLTSLLGFKNTSERNKSDKFCMR